MRLQQRFLAVACSIIIGVSAACAQKPALATVADTQQKVIKFTVKFGQYDSLTAPPTAIMKQMLAANLMVKDNSGSSWKVIKYSFAWRRKEMTQDYKTGQPKILWSYYGSDVDSSAKIPPNFQKEMQSGLQPTEHIVFDKILVENPKTKKLRQAPSLVLILK